MKLRYLLCLNYFSSFSLMASDVVLTGNDATRGLEEIKGDDDDVFFENAKTDKLKELAMPSEVFSGIYVSMGAGVDFSDNKIESDTCSLSVNGKSATGKIKENGKNNVKSLYAAIGFGDVFKNVLYLGLEMEMFKKFGGSKFDGSLVKFRSRNNMGLNFKSRIGYIIKDTGLMVYTLVGAERSINTVSFSNTNSHITFGSYHPAIGIGVEKKLRNNWSIRGEASYTIGVWDDTNKSLKFNINNMNFEIPFKAKANTVSLKLMISKYI